MVETETRVQTAWAGHYMEPAFWGFVSYCAKEPDAIEAFRKATGETYSPPTNAFDAMIDKSTGRDLKLVQSFVEWCEGQFGTPDNIAGEHADDEHE